MEGKWEQGRERESEKKERVKENKRKIGRNITQIQKQKE